MDFKKFFKKDLFLNNLEFQSKQEALSHFAQVLVEKGYAKDAKTVLDKALEREGQFSTGIGNKIAIPHIRHDVMNQGVILFANVKPMNWESLDGQPVEQVFFIALNQSEGENSHLEIIAALSRNFMSEEFCAKLANVKTHDELLAILEADSEEEKAVSSNSEYYDVVAVTACPTGIAHTFMAQQRLIDAAKKMGVRIKVETQGTEGPKNVLTKEDLDNAKGIILAVDKAIDLSRFAGRENVIDTGTKAVIKDAQKEIQNVLDNKGKKMAGTKSTSSSAAESEGSIGFDGFGRRIYKGVMNGVSYMLPFVVFGGILIALAFLLDIGNVNFIRNSSEAEIIERFGELKKLGDFGSIGNISKWLKTLGGISFGLMVPLLAAYLAYGLVGKMGLLPGFIVGFMAKGDFLLKINKEGVFEWFEAADVASGFFGAIAGGILAAAVVIVFSKYIFGKLPQSLMGIKNILFIPLLATFTTAFIFYFLNIPLIYVNKGFTWGLSYLEGNDYLLPILGLVLGLMMAADLGGPINKAAYVFGTATLAAQTEGSVAMAAVMAAGMVPPLAIALGASIFKNLYSKEQRNAALTNWIMGFSFISEGAIPFTAEKPKSQVPANLVGGAIAGLLVGLLKFQLGAPHGGIFVLPLLKSTIITAAWLAPILYLAVIVAASAVAMLVYVVLEKVYAKKEQKVKA
ncbi:fructose-specific PTS transporter subunit EIIC [Mycoplasma sp. Ms02]|uniref:PTS fructose transporter subunit IIABC n=1 Tax=Mycoplasma sp. Ms02 TaxID=353851 RepID=UPI001C894500|nr:fructose-specific PTS transporter subunit EIIC [Mycoplasma sp. Ms02]QZE12118.1 fructose-specific PTS transporter subunit EIIC [Mycoplasma sp. Ms02]